jgi:replicative DNA helicase
MKKPAMESTIPAPFLIGDVASDLLHGKPQQYVPTGLKALDDIIVGAVHGELMLVAAKPGQGKTSLLMTILENAAKRNVLGGVFSMEMGRRALTMRRIAGVSGVPIRAIRTGETSPKQKASIQKAAATLKNLPLYIDDRGGLSGPQIKETMGLWKEMGIVVVGLDYIQLMSGENESRQVQVGEAVRAVKEGAVLYDLPVIALSQLNRASDARENKLPRMSDLRDSGELEQVADTIMMFHYPEDDEDQPERVCDIHVVKQRNGPTGIASVMFKREQTRFEDI